MSVSRRDALQDRRISFGGHSTVRGARDEMPRARILIVINRPIPAAWAAPKQSIRHTLRFRCYRTIPFLTVIGVNNFSSVYWLIVQTETGQC